MEKYIIGVDLGGTKIKGAVAEMSGKIKADYTISTNAIEGEEAVLSRIYKVIDSVIEKANINLNEIKAIGIGSPGPLDAIEGVIIETPNLPFKNFNLVQPIKEKYGVSVFLDNDANAAALGEFMFGAGKGTKNMVYITVSTGVGGGAILNGNIYRGNTCNGLEIGHTTILPNGPRCNCGNYGCLEVLASGTAIGRIATEKIKEGMETSLADYDKVTAVEVFMEAKKGDLVAQEVLNTCLYYLGIGISNILNTFDPEMVVIGGGVSNGGSIVFKKIQEVVNDRSLKAISSKCKIVPASLGGDSGVTGAVALAMIESKNSIS